MNQQVLIKYRSLLEECRQKTNQINFDNDEGYLVRSAIFSANLTNFLPTLPHTVHQQLFRESLCNSAFENFDWNILEISELTMLKDDDCILDTKTEPFIFCSFHLGSYRVIANYLFKNGYDFSILVRGDVYERQAADLLDCARKVGKKYAVKSDMRIYNAEKPDVLLKVARELKAGRSLLVYVDGNTGTGNNAEKLDTISFLGQNLHLRKGIGYMSHLSGVPILPIVSYRKPDLLNVLEVGQAIYPNKELSRDDYSQQANQQLYDMFAKILEKYPSQWEGWNYVHKFRTETQNVESNSTKAKKIAYQNQYQFNYTRYCLINLRQSPILFDKKHYTTFEISVDLHDYLTNPTYPDPKHILGTRVFNQLVREQIMI
jgi:lauroyl/myristoyl acyltransferase